MLRKQNSEKKKQIKYIFYLLVKKQHKIASNKHLKKF